MQTVTFIQLLLPTNHLITSTLLLGVVGNLFATENWYLIYNNNEKLAKCTTMNVVTVTPSSLTLLCAYQCGAVFIKDLFLVWSCVWEVSDDFNKIFVITVNENLQRIYNLIRTLSQVHCVWCFYKHLLSIVTLVSSSVMVEARTCHLLVSVSGAPALPVSRLAPLTAMVTSWISETANIS